MTATPLNLCTYRWDLDEDACPCDLQFNAWLRQERVTGKSIFHFGTGSHHVVGVEQSTNGSGNAVLGITASLEELDAYLKIIASRADVSRSYLAYFGDIYLSNSMLLGRFDIVTMFHLCEFSDWYTVSSEYRGMDDRQLLDLFTAQLNAGGHMLFYTGSAAFDKVRLLLPDWEKQSPVEQVQSYEQLLVYRKGDAGP